MTFITLILSALLFSLSSNLDNLVIGIAYGIKKVKIGLIQNFTIALITTAGTFLSMSLGTYIAAYLPHSFANSLGSIMIAILGVYFLIQSIKNLSHSHKSKELALKDIPNMIEYAEESDLDKSGTISIKESILVAFGLTFNNLGTGIAASITGVSIKFTVIFTFIFSIFILFLGESIGNHVLGKFCGKYAPLFSGALLIVLGIIEFFN